jgi:hypothetical protein
LSEALDDTIKDLVAEARAHGAPWEEIGKLFDVGGTAAQKRFGKQIDQARLKDRRWEAAVARQTAEAAEGPYEGPAELLEELEGSTPAERIRYATSLMISVSEIFDRVDTALERGEFAGSDFLNAMMVVKSRLIRTFEAAVADPMQWQAIKALCANSPDPNAANFHSPATYWYFAMRQIWLATMFIAAVIAPDVDDNERIALFQKAGAAVRRAMLVLARPDVPFPVLEDAPVGPAHSPDISGEVS